MVKIEVHSRVKNTPYVREFQSYIDLLKTAKFQGEFFPWWDDATVRFEDGKSCSCSMVEIVDGRSVTIGVPAYYVTYHFKSYRKALEVADEIAQKWLDWEDKRDFRGFVDSVEVDKG